MSHPAQKLQPSEMRDIAADYMRHTDFGATQPVAEEQWDCIVNEDHEIIIQTSQAALADSAFTALKKRGFGVSVQHYPGGHFLRINLELLPEETQARFAELRAELAPAKKMAAVTPEHIRQIAEDYLRYGKVGAVPDVHAARTLRANISQETEAGEFENVVLSSDDSDWLKQLHAALLARGLTAPAVAFSNTGISINPKDTTVIETFTALQKELAPQKRAAEKAKDTLLDFAILGVQGYEATTKAVTMNILDADTIQMEVKERTPETDNYLTHIKDKLEERGFSVGPLSTAHPQLAVSVKDKGNDLKKMREELAPEREKRAAEAFRTVQKMLGDKFLPDNALGHQFRPDPEQAEALFNALHQQVDALGQQFGVPPQKVIRAGGLGTVRVMRDPSLAL